MLWQYYNYSNYVYRHVCILVTAYMYMYVYAVTKVYNVFIATSCNSYSCKTVILLCVLEFIVLLSAFWE